MNATPTPRRRVFLMDRESGAVNSLGKDEIRGQAMDVGEINGRHRRHLVPALRSNRRPLCPQRPPWASSRCR